jgi:hypothetical protein
MRSAAYSTSFDPTPESTEASFFIAKAQAFLN